MNALEQAHETRTQSDEDLLRLTGHTLRYYRKKAGHSKEDLEELSGISVASIYNLEHAVNNFQILTLNHLLDALHIPFYHFFRLGMQRMNHVVLDPLYQRAPSGIYTPWQALQAPDVTCRADMGHVERCIFYRTLNY